MGGGGATTEEPVPAEAPAAPTDGPDALIDVPFNGGVELGPTTPKEGESWSTASECQTTDSTTIASWQAVRVAAGQSAASGSFTWARTTTSSPLGSSMLLMGESCSPPIVST